MATSSLNGLDPASESCDIPCDNRNGVEKQGKVVINAFTGFSPSPSTMASAFFYGILMHPKILKRVLHNDASHLQICPAILMVGPFLLNRMHCVWLLIRPMEP